MTISASDRRSKKRLQMLYVDFNTSATDPEGRYFVNLRGESGKADALRPGQRVLLYDEVLQVQADLEYDEAAAEWWGRPDPSTYRDLPWPFQIRADLKPDAAGVVLIASGEDVALESCLAPQSITDYLRPDFTVILYNDAIDVSATVEEGGPGNSWRARPDWSTERPRPYPFRIPVDSSSEWIPGTMPLDPPALVLAPKAMAILRDSLRPGLLVVLLEDDSEYDAQAQHDQASGRWLARRLPRRERFVPAFWAPCIGGKTDN
jgi:hypothetical protein